MYKEKLSELLSDFDGIISIGFKAPGPGLEFYFRPGEIFPAASIIKVPILIEFFRQIEKGILDPEEKVRVLKKDHAGGAGIIFELHEGVELTLMDLARLMIVISDNSATNILISRLGFEKINLFMKEAGMTASCLKRFMMVPYGPEEENCIVVGDIIILLENLLSGKLLSSEYTGEAINILKRQQYNEKIPLYLPENLEIAHKTGELQGVRHDAGIIYFPGNPYLLCILTKEVKDVICSDGIIAKISKIIYEDCRKRLF